MVDKKDASPAELETVLVERLDCFVDERTGKKYFFEPVEKKPGEFIVTETDLGVSE